jgi:hypothetical protein
MIAVNVALTRFRNNIGIIEKIKEPLTFYSQGFSILILKPVLQALQHPHCAMA